MFAFLIVFVEEVLGSCGKMIGRFLGVGVVVFCKDRIEWGLRFIGFRRGGVWVV